MLKRAMLLTTATLFAGCASEPVPPTPYEAPPPVEITESPPEAPSDAPPPDQPSPPETTGKPQQGTGGFRVAIASADSAEVAAPWVQKAEAAGYRTEVQAVEIAGKTWHRVLLPGYATLDEAEAVIPFVQQELGAPDAWVTSRRRALGSDSAPADAPPPPPAPEQPAN